jgi:hypothetical protein
MVDTHAALQNGASHNVDSPTTPVGVQTGVVTQITRWIPTETVAIYVALLPLLAPITHGTSYNSRWILFTLMAAANPVVVLLLALAKAKEVDNSHHLPTWPGFSVPFFAMVASTVAFSAWAFALPDTPLGGISGYNTKWNIAILTGVTVGVALIANALHRSPELDQVQTQPQGAVPSNAQIQANVALAGAAAATTAVTQPADTPTSASSATSSSPAAAAVPPTAPPAATPGAAQADGGNES